MTFKDKLILTLLSIITIGIYPLIIFNKKSQSKEQLEIDSKISVDLTKLTALLGGKENIAGVEYTHTKVKVFIVERQGVNIDAITKLKGVSGVFATSKFVTLIVGTSAKTLATKLI